jgi:hypothetical protein
LSESHYNRIIFEKGLLSEKMQAAEMDEHWDTMEMGKVMNKSRALFSSGTIQPQQLVLFGFATQPPKMIEIIS